MLFIFANLSVQTTPFFHHQSREKEKADNQDVRRGMVRAPTKIDRSSFLVENHMDSAPAHSYTGRKELEAKNGVSW